jgi:hypothetical protein
MLQIKSVSPKLLELLNSLMKEPLLSSYFLVGGTGLALQFGHRKSIDIDLFGLDPFDKEQLRQTLIKFGQVEVLASSPRMFLCVIEGIKLDIVYYDYPLLEKLVEIDGIRIASDKDIAAMKLNAIAGRGRKKDFVDLELLLDHYSLKDMLGFYKIKFNQQSDFMVMKSLSYFEDADYDLDPEMLIEFNWGKTKEKILKELRSLMD